jgi:hypothetical protein
MPPSTYAVSSLRQRPLKINVAGFRFLIFCNANSSGSFTGIRGTNEPHQSFLGGEEIMVKNTMIVVAAAVAAMLMSACAPSLAYRMGQGFYSDQYAKQQVQAAANSGQVENLGRFEIVKGACFNYTQDQNDHNVIFPAVQEALEGKAGNAADQITANEEWYDFPLGLLIIPGLMGCSNWTVSGDVLRVKPVAATSTSTQPAAHPAPQ